MDTQHLQAGDHHLVLLGGHFIMYTFVGSPWGLQFNATFRLPSGVLGPVLRPPWNLHRPLAQIVRFLQGVPFLVLAPHRIPLHSSGKVGPGTMYFLS